MSSPRLNRWTAAAVAAALGPATAAAQGTPGNEELLQRIEELSQKVLVLERRLEIQDEAAQSTSKSTPVVKASPKGFSLESPDKQNVVKLRGTLHFDGRHFQDDTTVDTADTWLLRRVRPTLEGTLGGIYDFRFTPDFAGGRSIILDAFATARVQPWLAVTAGKFKVPVGLERLQSANDIRFVERAFPTSLLPNRDLGVSISGDLLDGAVNYSIGYYNGVTDGGSSDAIGDVDTDTAGDYAARLYATPFAASENFALRGLGLGIAGTINSVSGDAANPLLASYRTPGQQTFFRYRSNSTTSPGPYADGERLRWTPQLYYSVGRFGLLGEYAVVEQDISRSTTAGLRSDTVETTAWQVAAHWFLTGEEQAFKGFKPNQVFSIKDGTWGAWELVARYHELEIGDEAFAGGADSFADPLASPSGAQAWGVGLNWYLSENLKWVVDYEKTSFDGGAAGGDRPDEEVFLTRVAVGF
ncbi:MAG TPA: porin [Steroidobacteraceae bacterium]|nr:porin [Steroidobacteraceae bacterium]